MIARCLVALGGASLTQSEIAAGGLDQLERAEVTGSAPDTGDRRADWEMATASAEVPADALVLHWWRDE